MNKDMVICSASSNVKVGEIALVKVYLAVSTKEAASYNDSLTALYGPYAKKSPDIPGIDQNSFTIDENGWVRILVPSSSRIKKLRPCEEVERQQAELEASLAVHKELFSDIASPNDQ